MATILNWECEATSGVPAYRAKYKNLILRAVHDSSPECPFEQGDGNWTVCVRTSNNYSADFHHWEAGKRYDHILEGPDFNDALIVHDQRAIFAALGYDSIEQLLADYDTEIAMDCPPVKYCTDAEVLQHCFDQALDDVRDSLKLEALAKLYRISGVPAYVGTTRGYSQGDEAEVLVVATKADQERMGKLDLTEYREKARIMLQDRIAIKRHLPEAIEAKASELALSPTVDLYGAWAWGDVYGYTINREADAACTNCGNTLNDGSDVCDQCGGDFEDQELEELASCWGYYGAEFDESGLEQDAIDAAGEFVEEQETEDA